MPLCAPTLTKHISGEKVVLRHAATQSAGTFTVTVSVAGPDGQGEDTAAHIQGLRDLTGFWIPRRRRVRVSVDVCFNSERLLGGLREGVLTAVRRGGIWRQLGYEVFEVEHAVGSEGFDESDLLVFELRSGDGDDHNAHKKIYELCHRIPPKDVAPPKGVKCLELKELRLTLRAHGQVAATGASRKRLKLQHPKVSEEEMLLSEPPIPIAAEDFGLRAEERRLGGDESEEMLLSTPPSSLESQPSAGSQAAKRRYSECGEIGGDDEKERLVYMPPSSVKPKDAVTELDILVPMIDVGLRLSVNGNSEGKRSGSVDLQAKFLAEPVPLRMAMPALFQPGFLKEMATRAALVPTVSHALSQSIYTHTNSLQLRAKLEALLTSDRDHLGKPGRGKDRPTLSYQPPAKRLEATSAKLWQTLQSRLRHQSRPVRLESLQQFDKGDDLGEGEMLYASQADGVYPQDFGHSFEGQTAYEENILNNDELILCEPTLNRDAEVLWSDEDLFQPTDEGVRRNFCQSSESGRMESLCKTDHCLTSSDSRPCGRAEQEHDFQLRDQNRLWHPDQQEPRVQPHSCGPAGEGWHGNHLLTSWEQSAEVQAGYVLQSHIQPQSRGPDRYQGFGGVEISENEEVEEDEDLLLDLILDDHFVEE